jgi:hypothetical protein
MSTFHMGMHTKRKLFFGTTINEDSVRCHPSTIVGKRRHVYVLVVGNLRIYIVTPPLKTQGSAAHDCHEQKAQIYQKQCVDTTSNFSSR